MILRGHPDSGVLSTDYPACAWDVSLHTDASVTDFLQVINRDEPWGGGMAWWIIGTVLVIGWLLVQIPFMVE